MCDTLDLALSPKIIKAGFNATGIVPFNPDKFNEVDFVQAVEQNAEESAIEFELNEDDQRRIAIVGEINVGREEEVLTSEPSTSEPSTSEPSTSRSESSLSRPASSLLRPESAMSHATSCSSILDDIGPVQASTPRKQSNRGRKPMQSAELTSPENIANLKQKAAAKETAENEKVAAKKRAAEKKAQKEAEAIEKAEKKRAKLMEKAAAAKARDEKKQAKMLEKLEKAKKAMERKGQRSAKLSKNIPSSDDD